MYHSEDKIKESQKNQILRQVEEERELWEAESFPRLVTYNAGVGRVGFSPTTLYTLLIPVGLACRKGGERR